MTAVENKLLMQDLLGHVAAGDRAPLVAAIADDVVMTVTGQYSWSQVIKSKEALVSEFYGHLSTLLAEGRRTTPLRFIADDDFVVVESKGQMRTKAGVPYENDYCLIYRLRDGRIVEIKEYCDSVLTESVLGPYPAALKQPA